jgi:uncharacterized protein (DUF2236 family)
MTVEEQGTSSGRASKRPAALGAPLRPGSLLWSTAGDPRSLLTGSTAGIMQLMLPGLGAGVTDHSNFFDDPLDRILRSIPAIWGTIFVADSEGDEPDRRGRSIRDLHTDIKGSDDHGRRYHALDPEIFWWAHATFTWEMLRARQLYFGVPLRRSQQEQLYAESVTWFRRYGVSERAVPATLSTFERRFDDICRTELELTPAVSWVLDPKSNPASHSEPLSLPGLLKPLSAVATRASSDALRLLVYGAMPDVVRRRFGFRWSNADRLAFAGLAAALRASGPAVRRGALAQLWPPGTPHLAPGSTDRVIEAPPLSR